jgi:polyisoprenoid-binding protein YceI
VQRFPFALIRVSGPAAMTADARLGLEITLHGMTRRFDLPVRIAMADGGLNVAGTLEFDQSEFGIVPFSVLGGAIQVQDRLTLRFSLQARRAGAQDGAAPWSMQ